MINLRELRIKHNITQIKLAELLGVTQAAVSQWENGTVNPDISYVKKIAAIFGCTADELLGIEKTPAEQQA